MSTSFHSELEYNDQAAIDEDQAAIDELRDRVCEWSAAYHADITYRKLISDSPSMRNSYGNFNSILPGKCFHFLFLVMSGTLLSYIP
jgi:hypothetical protein